MEEVAEITIRSPEDIGKLTPAQAAAVLRTMEAEAAAFRYRQDPVAFVRERLNGKVWADYLPDDPKEVRRVLDAYIAWFDSQGFADDYIARFRNTDYIPDKQSEILEAFRDHRQVVVASANSIGKTWIASDALVWFLETQPASVKALSTAPNDDSVRRLLWGYARKKYKELEGPRGRLMPAEPEIRVDEDSFGRGYVAKEAAGFQGHHATSICMILDEAVGVRSEFWEAARSMLRGGNGRLLAIGNPTHQSGDFYEAFHSRSATWHPIYISAFDHPNVILGREVIPGAVTRENLLEDRLEWGEGSPAWMSRVLGKFPDQSDDQLIAASWVEAARNQSFSERPPRTCGRCVFCRMAPPPEDDSTTVTVAQPKDQLPIRCQNPPPPEKTAGLDVASEGDDRGVLTLVTDGVVESIEVWQKKDTTHYADVAERAIKSGYVVRVDATGLGIGVTDTLKSRGYRAGKHYHAVNFGASPVDKARYPRVKDELWGNLASILRNEEISFEALPEHTYRSLWADLVSVQRKENVAGKIETESKKERRARGVTSPDIGDSLALAVYHPGSGGFYVGSW